MRVIQRVIQMFASSTSYAVLALWYALTFHWAGAEWAMGRARNCIVHAWIATPWGARWFARLLERKRAEGDP